eukprot:1964989-Rhodomonas_salina.1
MPGPRTRKRTRTVTPRGTLQPPPRTIQAGGGVNLPPPLQSAPHHVPVLVRFHGGDMPSSSGDVTGSYGTC